ncbi:MAG: DNA alkylation repair protein [Gammaproteobacteria bacterium]|nr:DNA alkylation repair protein [Gammaproteobacteria bacterium]
MLYDCIGASAGHGEFFVQKAMGWALRDYSRTDPDEVCRYVDAMGPALPRLTQREACKHLG